MNGLDILLMFLVSLLAVTVFGIMKVIRKIINQIKGK